MALNDKLEEFKSSLNSIKTALSNKGVSVSELTADQVATNINKINTNQTVTQSLGTRSVTLPAISHKINVKVRCQYKNGYGPAPVELYFDNNIVTKKFYSKDLSFSSNMSSTSWATGSYTHTSNGWDLSIRAGKSDSAGNIYTFTTESVTPKINLGSLSNNSTSTFEIVLKNNGNKPTSWT